MRIPPDQVIHVHPTCRDIPPQATVYILSTALCPTSSQSSYFPSFLHTLASPLRLITTPAPGSRRHTLAANVVSALLFRDRLALHGARHASQGVFVLFYLLWTLLNQLYDDHYLRACLHFPQDIIYFAHASAGGITAANGPVRHLPPDPL